MKTTTIVAAILWASAVQAAPPVPIAFETIVDLDSFRVTNRGSAHVAIWKIVSYPATSPRVTTSDPVFYTPAFADDESRTFGFAGLLPREWAQFTGPIPERMDVHFLDLETRDPGLILAPIINGTFTGATVPEPAAWLLAVIVAGLLAVAYRLRGNR